MQSLMRETNGAFKRLGNHRRQPLPTGLLNAWETTGDSPSPRPRCIAGKPQATAPPQDRAASLGNHRRQPLPKTALHRFFNLNIQKNRQPQKLTAVILKNQQSDNQKRVAIVTQQLKGILAVEPSCLKPLTDRDNVSPILRECCSALVQTELQTTYIVDSAALLNRLHQESILVSA